MQCFKTMYFFPQLIYTSCEPPSVNHEKCSTQQYHQKKSFTYKLVANSDVRGSVSFHSITTICNIH